MDQHEFDLIMERFDNIEKQMDSHYETQTFMIHEHTKKDEHYYALVDRHQTYLNVLAKLMSGVTVVVGLVIAWLGLFRR